MSQRTWNTFAPIVERAGTDSATARPSHSKTVAVLVVGDVLGAAVAGVFGAWLAAQLGVVPGEGDSMLLLALFGLMPCAYAIAGLYPGIGLARWDELRLLTLYGTSVFAVLALPSAIAGNVSSLTITGFAWAAAAVAVPAMRFVVREMASRTSWWGVPIVVLGAGRAGSALLENLQADHRTGLRPVAALDDDPNLLGALIYGVPVAGTLADADLYREDGVRHALVAMPSAGPERLKSLIQHHARRFPVLIVVPDFVGLGSTDAAVCSFDGLMGFRLRQNLLVRRNLILKRMMDLMLVVPAAVVALPVVALAALTIQFVSPGNPFFAQRRVGKGGVPFDVWKLRTMYLDADVRLERTLAEDPRARQEWETTYKLRNDTRILPVIGHILRVSSMDELPQIWNILRGQMSFVGPRPFPGYHMAAFDEEFRDLREGVAPGLTGLWQITSRSDSDLEVQKHLDSLYIANWSPWLDLYVLAGTPAAVITGHGAH